MRMRLSRGGTRPALHLVAFIVLLLGAWALSSPHPAAAQSFVAEVSLGAVYPHELAGGLYPALGLHKVLDRKGVLRFDLGVAAAFYRREYLDLAEVVAGADLDAGRNQTLARVAYTRTMVPLLAALTMKISFVDLNLPSFPGIGWLARAGMEQTTDLRDAGLFLRPFASYTRLRSEEKNRDNAVLEEERTYSGWGGGSELGIYLTTKSNVTTAIGVLYQRATPSREANSDVPNLPAARDLKLHGMGYFLRMGVGF